MVCATIGEVIASNGCNDYVIEIESANSFGNALGLVFFEREGLGGFDSTETAGAGADITSDHEGCGAAAPTFPAVRALSTFANGVEL